MDQRGPNPISNQEFFATLPSEITMDILARLPPRTIMNCLYVCKSWFSLITNHEFSSLSKPVPLLAFYAVESYVVHHAYSLFEVEEGPHHELHFNPVVQVYLSNHRRMSISGSANGLLFLQDRKSPKPEVFLICNPITREYVRLPYPQTVTYGSEASKRVSKSKNPKMKVKNLEISCGFGASRITGQLKVVRVFKEWWENPEFDCDCERYYMFPKRHSMSKEHYCEVYTLGTGSWIRTTLDPAFHYINKSSYPTYPSFLNGNLHWLVDDKNSRSWISCFDLETELFSTFSTPELSHVYTTSLSTLGDCLCLCENRHPYEIVVWLMKEYGDDKSWTKEFVIRRSSRLGLYNFETFYPVKVLSDGVLLIASNGRLLVQYSKKYGSFPVHYPWKNRDLLYMSCSFLFRHTPSYLSLKLHLGMENVRSL